MEKLKTLVILCLHHGRGLLLAQKKGLENHCSEKRPSIREGGPGEGMSGWPLQSLAQKVKKVKLLSRVQLFATPWTVACQLPPSMGFSRPEYWSALPFPSSGDLPNPGIERWSPAL